MRPYQRTMTQQEAPTPHVSNKKSKVEKPWVMEHMWVDKKSHRELCRNGELLDGWYKTFVFSKYSSPQQACVETTELIRNVNGFLNENFFQGRDFRLRNRITGKIVLLTINKTDVIHG